MSKHTPGPWETKHHGEWITGKDAVHGEVVIAKAEFDWEANARLIAAAPDLLLRATALLEALDRDLPHNMKHHAAGERFNLRAAIAKAEGDARCPLCGYQHGHAIGCKNNPVDKAIAAMAKSTGGAA